MKTALLLDINDTLDDHSNHEERRRINNSSVDSIEYQLQLNGVMPLRDWIDIFASFLEEYNERIIPIFWSAVGIHWQSLLARYYFWEAQIVWNSAWEFIPNIRNYDLSSQRGIGIWSPKSKHMSDLREFIRWKASRIVWFEDSIRGADKEYVDTHDDVFHVWLKWRWNEWTQDYSREPDKLVDKVEEIKRLII